MAMGPANLNSYSTAGTSAWAESQRAFMEKVYAWMFVGLALTGGIGWYVGSNVELAAKVMPLYLPLSIGELLLVLAFSFLATRVSAGIAGLMFLVYAAMSGPTFSAIFLVYRLDSIGQVFFATAGTFIGMSIYGSVTKKDLTSWSSFLMMGLWGVLIAGVVNVFTHSSMLDFVASCMAVVVFTGLTAYDTQKLRALHAVGGSGGAASLAVVGALSLYLDFINLFFALLRLFGKRR